jgi:hypothetical protein
VISPRIFPNEKLAVNVRVAAAMLSISPRMIYLCIRAKHLPARKIGRRTVIRVRDLEIFLHADKPSPIARRPQ